jgi:Domain of unknown function (DUF4372)
MVAFAQLTFRESLRDIEVCLRAHESKLYHQILIQMGERFCGVVRRNARRSDEMCATEENPSVGAKTSLPTYIGNHQGRKAPVSQIQVQVGNTQKVLFPILYQ